MTSSRVAAVSGQLVSRRRAGNRFRSATASAPASTRFGGAGTAVERVRLDVVM